MTETPTEFNCKGKTTEGTPCPLKVTYVPRVIHGNNRSFTKSPEQASKVEVYLRCEDGHINKYSI